MKGDRKRLTHNTYVLLESAFLSKNVLTQLLYVIASSIASEYSIRV